MPMPTIVKKKLAADVFIVMTDEDGKPIDNYTMDRTCVDMEVLVNSLPPYRLGVNGKNVKATIRLHLKGYKK
jgi:hypothetical protein